jgi:proline iminopeptidase
LNRQDSWETISYSCRMLRQTNGIKLYGTLFIGFFSFAVLGQQLDFVSHVNGKLYYHQYGKGEVVILLSGGPGSSYRQVESIATGLSDAYRVILPEQRGTGKSIPVPHDSTTINLATAREDIGLLLSGLGLQKAIIVGHSWGARLALSFACRYPDKVKELVLVSPGLFNTTQPMRTVLNDIIEGRMSQTDITLLMTYLRKMQKGVMNKSDSVNFGKLETMPFVYDVSRIDSLYNDISAGGSNVKTTGLILQDLKKINFNLTHDLPRLQMPVTIICGREDPLAFVPYEIKLLLPGASLFWIERCGHFPMFEQPALLNRTLHTVLSSAPKNK